MSVKFNQSGHQFSDSSLSLVTQHRTRPQGVTEWFFLLLFTYFLFISPFCNYDTSVQIKKKLHIH